MTHQGHTNYETFTIAVEIDNDEELLDRWLEAARNAEDTISLADQMKDSYEEEMPEIESSVFSTLLNAAMAEINWYELAGDKLKDFGEQIKPGTTSQGSCKLDDIVDGVRDLLPDSLLEEFDECDEDEPDYDEARSDIFTEICERLDEIAPEGLSFGASEGDGADYGFWKIETDTCSTEA